jgi:hypothetical protein
MTHQELLDHVQRRIAASQLAHQDALDGLEVKRQLRIRQIVESVLQQNDIALNGVEHQAVIAAINERIN